MSYVTPDYRFATRHITRHATFFATRHVFRRRCRRCRVVTANTYKSGLFTIIPMPRGIERGWRIERYIDIEVAARYIRHEMATLMPPRGRFYDVITLHILAL